MNTSERADVAVPVSSDAMVFEQKDYTSKDRRRAAAHQPTENALAPLVEIDQTSLRRKAAERVQLMGADNAEEE